MSTTGSGFFAFFCFMDMGSFGFCEVGYMFGHFT